METYIDLNYLFALSITWIVGGWINQVKADCESTYDTVLLYHTFLYDIFIFITVLAPIVSLIINAFMVGLVSTLCYVGAVFLVQIINRNVIYYIYRFVFGREGLGAIVPMICYIPSLIYLFVVQFS